MSELHIQTKGKGAGGANTNKNGLSYETKTDLSTEYNIIQQDKYSKKVTFTTNQNISLLTTKQHNLFKCMDKNIDKNIYRAHGCKNPDECFIDEATKTMFIIEKKFQQTAGSVCEKIQTPDFKIWQYSRTFPNYTIIYIYCLSDWFKYNCKAEIEYLEYKKIPLFWGNSDSYKTDIVNFMIDYLSIAQPS